MKSVTCSCQNKIKLNKTPRFNDSIGPLPHAKKATKTYSAGPDKHSNSQHQSNPSHLNKHYENWKWMV